MRIISPFHDYYDTAMAFGQDPSNVFVRRTELIERSKANEKYETLATGLDRADEKRTDKYTAFLTRVKVVFCGKLYNGVHVEVSKPFADPPFITLNDFFYDYDTLVAHLAKYKISFNTKQAYSWDMSRGRTQAQRYENFLSVQGDASREEFLIENQIVTMVLAYGYRIEAMYGVDVPVSGFNGKWHERNFYALNPPLKAFQFFKVMDPYTAFQELEMWIGGVLPRPGQMMVNIEDKYRIPQHGFDKWSFRKMPAEKK